MENEPNYIRELKLEKHPSESFFIWGPRQAGKSFLLRYSYPDSLYINLLDSRVYLKYLKEPWLLKEEVLSGLKTKKIDKKNPIIIDEIQKVPLLLDEVHLMIEEYGLKFGLCGSSARKVKAGQANLLGGRAIKHTLFGFSAFELKRDFDLTRLLNQGYLPNLYLSNEKKSKELRNFYISDYLKEEIAAEGLVRNLPVFGEFLRIAAFSDAETVNFSNIARDCGISSNTVKEYFCILEDTLVGSFLSSYRKKNKRKLIQSPKFYFSDIAVVNVLLKRENLSPGSEIFGKAFENWVYHELVSYNSYKKKFWDLSYWRLSSGAAEVDFIVNDMECAIETKAKSKIKKDELNGLRELKKEQSKVKKMIVVSLVEQSRITEDEIEILSYQDFVDRLWSDSLLES